MPLTPFHCTLCSKSYARSTELEAHENSYDHQHKKRLKEMKSLTRNPTALVSTSRADRRRREDRGNGALGGNKLAPSSAATAGGGTAAGAAGTSGREGAGEQRGFRPATGFAGVETVHPPEQEEQDEQGGMVEMLGPLRWEELGRVRELLDMSSGRSEGARVLADMGAAHMRRRTDAEYFRNIWAGTQGSQSAREGSESPHRAIGLGA